MSVKLLHIICKYCGEEHRFPLDDDGRFSGPFPCDPTKHAVGQVEGRKAFDAVDPHASDDVKLPRRVS